MTQGQRGAIGIVTLVLATAALLIASDLWIRRDLQDPIRQALEAEAHTIRGLLPGDRSTWPALLATFERGPVHRIAVVDGGGSVLAAGGQDPSETRPASLADRPEIQDAMAGRTGLARRRNVALGSTFLHLAVPGEPIIRVSTDLSGIDAIVRRAQRAILTGALIALLIGIGLHLLNRRTYLRPLADLERVVRTMPAGEGPRFARSGVPEVDALAESLRQVHNRVLEQLGALEAERRRGDTLVDTMVEGVLACDERGNVIRANPAIRALLGYGAGEPLPLLSALFFTKAARALVDRALAGETIVNGELQLDGRALMMNASPLPPGGTVMVFRDLTDLRRLETVRRDFVANVSHELKTPLTSIAGYTETLLKEEVDRETTVGFLTIIDSNARRMHDLIEDQLDLARIESGQYPLSPAPLDALEAIEGAWARYRERATERKVQWSVVLGDDAKRISADPRALQQILDNLFSNALRYTGPGGSIGCRTERTADGVSISVADTGSGIAGEHLPRIFERFYRVDPSRSRAEGGTGLGLSIVKHLVEGHGGRVVADSTLGQGTTIRCSFPDR